MGVTRKCEKSWHWPGGGGILFPGLELHLRPERRESTQQQKEPGHLSSCPLPTLPALPSSFPCPTRPPKGGAQPWLCFKWVMGSPSARTTICFWAMEGWEAEGGRSRPRERLPSRASWRAKDSPPFPPLPHPSTLRPEMGLVPLNFL